MVQNLKQLLTYDLIFIDENSNIRLITESWYLIYKKDVKMSRLLFLFQAVLWLDCLKTPPVENN